jgi:hypothetical protein
MLCLLYWVLITPVAISFTGNHPVWAEEELRRAMKGKLLP